MQDILLDGFKSGSDVCKPRQLIHHCTLWITPGGKFNDASCDKAAILVVQDPLGI